MSQISLVVTLRYVAEAKTQVLQALLAHKQRCLSTEPGTIQFEILSPSEDSNELLLFELYENESALSAHDLGVSLALFKEQAGAFIESASARKCKVHML